MARRNEMHIQLCAVYIQGQPSIEPHEANVDSPRDIRLLMNR